MDQWFDHIIADLSGYLITDSRMTTDVYLDSI